MVRNRINSSGVNRKAHRNYERITGIILIIASIAVSITFGITASKRPLTQLEMVSFQAITLIFSISGAFIFGRQSAMQAAREIIKPHARSAFRRLLSLYTSLSRLATTITNARSAQPMKNSPILDKLEAIVTEQIVTADDALKDWEDIVPDDVDEIRKKLKGTNKGGE
jgi:hypothetical protein